MIRSVFGERDPQRQLGALLLRSNNPRLHRRAELSLDGDVRVVEGEIADEEGEKAFVFEQS